MPHRSAEAHPGGCGRQPSMRRSLGFAGRTRDRKAVGPNPTWGKWAVQLLQCTASVLVGSGQRNSYNALPLCLGAMGSATPAMPCFTAWRQWAVQLLQCTASLPPPPPPHPDVVWNDLRLPVALLHCCPVGPSVSCPQEVATAVIAVANQCPRPTREQVEAMEAFWETMARVLSDVDHELEDLLISDELDQERQRSMDAMQLMQEESMKSRMLQVLY